MKVIFHLLWKQSNKSFKSKPTKELFEDYVKRINGFDACQYLVSSKFPDVKQGEALWVCERQKNSKQMSSEELANVYDDLQSQGFRILHVVIGGADGFTQEEIHAMKPNLCWSFGKFTLPHELASVVASEQIYRAITILKNHPYHCGH